jgi:hypothetical protein
VVFVQLVVYTYLMIRGRTIVLVLSSFALAAGTPPLSADVADNPYQGIVDRNLFNLKPPPRPEDSLPPPEPPPKITLTGFTTILGDKRVLFKVQVPAKPPQPAKEESYILTEGQRDGDIEVLEINEKTGVAKFNNHGMIQTLDMANDGAKPSNPPAPTAGPPAKPYSPFAARNPNMPESGAAMRTIPPRTLRIPQLPGTPPTARTFPGAPGPQPPNVAQ